MTKWSLFFVWVLYISDIRLKLSLFNLPKMKNYWTSNQQTNKQKNPILFFIRKTTTDNDSKSLF